jgi:hypothetical protein
MLPSLACRQSKLLCCCSWSRSLHRRFSLSCPLLISVLAFWFPSLNIWTNVFVVRFLTCGAATVPVLWLSHFRQFSGNCSVWFFEQVESFLTIQGQLLRVIFCFWHPVFVCAMISVLVGGIRCCSYATVSKSLSFLSSIHSNVFIFQTRPQDVQWNVCEAMRSLIVQF